MAAETQDARAHTIAMFKPETTANEISFFSSLAVQDGYDAFVGGNSHAIVQPTHYLSSNDYVGQAAACFGAQVIATDVGRKTVASIGRSTLVIESSDRCGARYTDECDVVAMTFVPPAGDLH